MAGHAIAAPGTSQAFHGFIAIGRAKIASRGIMRMMRTNLYRAAIVVAALVLASGGRVFAQDVAKGAALIADARKALGGDEKIRGVKTLQAKGDFKRTAGQNTISGELQVQLALPDKLRRDEDLSPPGGGPAIVRTQVLNGAEIWDENSGGGGFGFRGAGPDGGGRDGGGGFGFGRGDGPRAGGQRRDAADQPPAAAGQPGQGRGGRQFDPEQIRQLQIRQRQEELARFTLAFLLTTTDPVSWVGVAESPDGKADVVEVKPADGAATRIFLDQATHLPVMLTWQGFAPPVGFGRRGGRGDGSAAPVAPADRPAAPPRPQQATLRMTLGDYKTVNGIKLPHLMTRGVNDQTNEEWTVSSYRINPTFKGDTFTKK